MFFVNKSETEHYLSLIQVAPFMGITTDFELFDAKSEEITNHLNPQARRKTYQF